MRASFPVACALIYLEASATTVSGQEIRHTDTCPLSMHVGGFESSSQSRIATIVRFARQYKISFGITRTEGIYSPVEVHAPSGTVRSILNAILGSSPRVPLTCAFGVVIIGGAAGSPSWLARRVPEFKIPRSTVGAANVALWMRVELIEDPSQRGFAGSYMGDPGPMIGPFDIRGATVQSLLSRLASAWPGTGWVADQVHPDLPCAFWANRFWTVLPNDDRSPPQGPQH